MANRGTRVRQALVARGIGKQQALAAELGVHESAITRWKEGKAMSLDSAIAFCAALDLSLDWLLLGRGDMEPRGSTDTARTDDLLRSLDPRISRQTLALFVSLVDSIAQDVSLQTSGRPLR